MPEPADEPQRTRPGDPASRAVSASLARAVQRLQAAGPMARDGQAEGVHRLRTSARRLRSELQAFGKLVDEAWGEKLAAELKWLGNAIGEVRDLDVLRDRFSREEADGDEETLKPLFDWLDERHEKASQAMRETLQSQRFRDLMDMLAEEPALGEKADKPCRKVMPRLAAKAWKRLRDDSEDVDQGTADETFHDIRKRGKRARYTSELVAPILGEKVESKAGRVIRLATRIQDVLGEHQDAVVAAAEVRAFLDAAPRDEAFRLAADRLLERLRKSADESRDKFLDKLRPKLFKPKNRGLPDADG